MIWLDALRTALIKRYDAVSEQLGRLQEVISDNRLKYVQFEVSLTGCKANRCIISHHLGSNHCNGFALSRIYFSRHDGTSRFIGRNRNFPNSAARTARQPAEVIANLHH